MDTKNITMMVIGLAVAVIIVAGVLVPVISSSLEGDSEGSGYTNTGDYYYKTAVEGENHTLVVDTAGDNVTITYDGSVIHTIPMGDAGWSIPLFLTEYVPNASNAPLLYSLSYMIEGVSSSGVLNKTPYIKGYSLHGDYNSSDISLPHTFNISGTAITGMNNITLTSYMADTGDLVLAESPVIDPEQYIYTSQCFQLASTAPVDDVITIKYVVIDASGTSDTIGIGKKSYTESDGISVAGADYDWTTYKYNGTAWKYKDWYNCDSADDGFSNSDITVRTSESPYGVKLDGIDATVHWDGHDPDTVTLTKFVVPVEVGGSGGSGISPTLKSMISIIPLIVTVGIVLSAITMIRTKN